MLKRVAFAFTAVAFTASALVTCHPAPSTHGVSQTTAIPPAPPLMDWPDLTSRPRPNPTYTLAVAGAPAADLWLPSGNGPFPVVLMIHGGCWQKHIADRTLMNYAAEALRLQGFAVWNIEYRGVDEVGGGYPVTFQDVANAADALRDLAARYPLDLSRVVGFGHSAGGHLIAWLAARPKLPLSSPLHSDTPLPLRGIVMAGGLPDLHTAPQGCTGSSVPNLLGAATPTRADLYADTSPAELLPLNIPQVSINGDGDPVSTPAMAQAYTARAIKAGDHAEAVIVPNAGHVEEITPGTPIFAREVQALQMMSAN
ncbi:MAG: alpha/beta hydrolase [Terricaulis sp.]